MNPDEVKQLRQLESENARLTTMLAERSLEIYVMKQIAAKKGAPAHAERRCFTQ
ncbi:hypothetical protein J5J83_15095 [Azoarcus sp. L1K30]|nr:hypothetical protein [Azoarcus sp. L1K30]